jgi:3-hydroxybutyryl-CoA dehydratase
MSYNPNSPLVDAWTETSSQMVEGFLAANRAAIAAWGGTADADDAGADDETEESRRARVEANADLPEWHVEATTGEREQLSVGDRFEFSKTITEADIERFAVASGDTNPLHLDDEYADDTRFQGRIAHGTLVGGLISAALARIPGLVVYLSQDLEFHSPVRIDDRVTAECEIIEDLGNNQYRLRTRVMNGDEAAIDGEAVILIDEQPE